MRAATVARLSFALLAIATFLAIFYAQELKGRSALLLRPNRSFVQAFQPAGPLRTPATHREAHLRVQASVTDTLEVGIVSVRTGVVAAVLVVPVHAYRSAYPVWNGTTAPGRLAAPGDYRLRIHFEHRGSTVLAPETLRLLGAAR